MTISFPTLRALRRDWRTVALVVFSIALAIAVNSTVVSLLEALIHPKMDMRAPDRLYWVSFYGDFAHRLPAAARDSILLSHSSSFTLTTWAEGPDNAVVLENGERYTAATSALTGPGFFAVAGITPVRGRALTPQDTSIDPPAILLSQSVASQLFGTESPLGRAFLYQRKPRRGVGVLGDQAEFPNSHVGVWSLVAGDPQWMRRLIRVRDGHSSRDVLRALDSASADVGRIVHEAPGSQVAFRLRPAVQTQFHYENFHYAIAAACVALLLIACANAANLELSRTTARRRQLAIRAALGASPFALVRDVLAEEALLAAIAAVAALCVTAAAAHTLYALVPPRMGEFVVQPHVGWRVVTFATVIAVLATLLVGCAPAIRSAHADPQEALKETSGIGRSHRRYDAALVAIELGLAIALSCGAIAMIRAPVAFDAEPVGYDAAPLVGGSLWVDGVASARDGMETLRRRLASVDGVASAAVTLKAQVRNHYVTVEDSTGALIQVPAPGVQYSMVTPGYLETLGVPIAQGAGFNPAITSEPQVVIDRKSASRLWPGRDPIGQRLKLGGLTSALLFARVVGVIGAVPEASRLRVVGPPPPEHTLGGIFYLPVPNDPLTATGYSGRGYEFVTRTTANPSQVILAIRRSLITVGNAGGSSVAPMDEILGISRARAGHRFLMLLFAFFALCGLALSSVAVSSIIARSVTERRRELAVRRALGAQAPQILHAVLRETVPVALLGVALGLALTKYAIPLLASQALSDDRFNAPLYALTSVMVVAMLGPCIAVPAFRATGIPTSEALRSG
jgi:predicted permease